MSFDDMFLRRTPCNFEESRAWVEAMLLSDGHLASADDMARIAERAFVVSWAGPRVLCVNRLEFWAIVDEVLYPGERSQLVEIPAELFDGNILELCANLFQTLIVAHEVVGDMADDLLMVSRSMAECAAADRVDEMRETLLLERGYFLLGRVEQTHLSADAKNAVAAMRSLIRGDWNV